MVLSREDYESSANKYEKLLKDFNALSTKLQGEGIDFIIEPYIRFKGEAGEQATMFFLDPAGNALEFKAFKNIEQLFAVD